MMRGASILLAVASALLVPSISAKCTYNDAHVDDSEINAWIAGCGASHEVARCFEEGLKSTDLNNCLVSSGCDGDVAQLVQAWYENDCEEVRPFEGGLRRRQRNRPNPYTESSEELEAETPEQTQAPERATTFPTTSIARAPLITLAPRQDDETPLTCLTTSMISTSYCFLPTDVGATTTCVPTSTASVGCNHGLLCKTTAKGTTVCMKAQDTPPLSGIIVSIALGVFLSSMLSSVIFMSCRSRRASRRAEKQREAMLIASGAKSPLGGNAMASEAHLPLIHAHGPQDHQRDVSADYGGAKEYTDRGLGSRRVSPTGSFQDASSSLRSPSIPRKPMVGLGDVGMSNQPRNPLSEDDTDIGYGRHL